MQRNETQRTRAMMPGLTERVLALSFYLGAAPFIRPGRARRFEGFVATHHAAAIGSWFLLCLVGVTLLFSIFILSTGMILTRSLYEHWHAEPHVLDIIWKLFLAWGVVHLFCAGHALAGSSRRLPLVNELGRRDGVGWMVRISSYLITFLALTTSAVATHAATLVRSDEGPGKVYFVYEDNGVVPHWVFYLGVYRLALQSRASYGPDQTVLLRISRDHLMRAFREGTFVVIGSHGQAQGIIAERQWFTPQEIKPGDVGRQLRYVYLTGCDSGAQVEQWQRALQPAQVVTHNRLTAVVEHVWWMWFTGPNQLREVVRKEMALRPGGTPASAADPVPEKVSASERGQEPGSKMRALTP